jgi:hypothetical protein
MTWVRFDDLFPIHRKVAPLDDATFRLQVEAVSWCSRNTTDGRIAGDELDTISKRATRARAANLVKRGIWHQASETCPSEKCPPPGADGWVIHDYLEYQFSRERIRADLQAKADRTKRWRERKATQPSSDADGDASQRRHRDASRDASPTRPDPTRPAPKGAGTGRGSTEPPCPTCANPLDSPYHRNVCRAAHPDEEVA